MPETSADFAKLELSLAEASGLLLGLPMHDVGGKTEQLKLRSYVLLCHAALEEYLERVSLSVLSESMKAFENDGKIRDPLLSVCSYYKILLNNEAQDRIKNDSSRDLLGKIFRKAINEHTVSLEGVHGIKTKDQDAILLPIGVNLFNFDRLLSQGLNSFGETRGKFAHSFRLKVVTPRAGLESNVKKLLQLLQPLDNMLCERHAITYQ